MDNLCTSAKIKRLNCQDSLWDRNKINHVASVILLPCTSDKLIVDTLCITVAIRYGHVNIVALHMNGIVPSIKVFMLRSHFSIVLQCWAA